MISSDIGMYCRPGALNRRYATGAVLVVYRGLKALESRGYYHQSLCDLPKK